jgi:hypothetical protein
MEKNIKMCPPYTPTISGQRENLSIGIVPEHGVSRLLIQRGKETIMISLAEIAIGKSVSDSRLIGILYKMIIAVPIQMILPHQKFRKIIQPPDGICQGIFRAVGPGLIAVHKDFFFRVYRDSYRSLYRLDDTLGQFFRHMNGTSLPVDFSLLMRRYRDRDPTRDIGGRGSLLVIIWCYFYLPM